MMNNKGFTLIEVISVLVLLSVILVVVFRTFGTTMSAGKEASYKVMKDNIISIGYDYVNECNLGTIQCDYLSNGNNKFTAKALENVGFFKDLKSPIDGKYLGNCLVLEVAKTDGVTKINLIDNCY